MLNRDLAEKSRSRLQTAVNDYNRRQKALTGAATDLHRLRVGLGLGIISEVEVLASMLPHPPEEFDKTLGELRLEFQNFERVVAETGEKLRDVEIASGTSVVAGAAAGAATAALAPAAAMAIATTFGTASTGTAIASLSGVAATNAALAWLGGGAIAAGGGGMAGGSALLALAGPLGWGIAGLAAAGGSLLYAHKNKGIAEQADSQTDGIRDGIRILRLAEAFVKKLTARTQHEVDCLRALVAEARALSDGAGEVANSQIRTINEISSRARVLTLLMRLTASEYLARYDRSEKAKEALRSAQLRSFILGPEARDDAEAELGTAKEALAEYERFAAAEP